MVSTIRASAEAVSTAINGTGTIVSSPAERGEDDQCDQKEAHRILKKYRFEPRTKQPREIIL
jgi:hypothetical protein